MSSSCCDDADGNGNGNGNGSSAFESYDCKNNPNHQRNLPIPLSNSHPTNTLHQFIPIRNGIFAGTMLQDRPKRPASLRFELGGERQLQAQLPMSTQSPYLPVEEESKQPRTPSTLFISNPNAEPDYKALHLQSEIRAHEHQREISRLQEQKRQLRLKLIALQAQLLESQTQQQEQCAVPFVEDSATPQNENRRAVSESKSLSQHFDDDEDCPPVQIVTYSIEQQQQHPEHQLQEVAQLCSEQHSPLEAHEKENVHPTITSSIVHHKTSPEVSSSDDCVRRNHVSRRRKRLHIEEVAFETNGESTPPRVPTTRRSTRRRAKTTVATTTATTPPESPPHDGLVDAMVRSAVRKSKRREQSGDGGARSSQGKSVMSSSSSPLLEQLNQSCKSLSPIPMNDDEHVEDHPSLSEDNDTHDNSCPPPRDVVPAMTTVGTSVDHHIAATAATLAVQGHDEGSDTVEENIVSEDPRRKRRRKGLLLLPNSFQAPALKKKKGKKG